MCSGCLYGEYDIKPRLLSMLILFFEADGLDNCVVVVV